MKKNIILIALAFYCLILLQTSFLVHFSVFGAVPNLVLIVILLINLLEKSEGQLGLWSSLFAGFLLDIFSGWPIGSASLLLILFSIFLKLILKRYVRIPFIKRI